jgi:ribA/ribD-fused uncharacterized protein
LCYPTVEHAYQAAKTLDQTERVVILAALSPGSAKRLGKTVTKRTDWDDITKINVMAVLLKQKFADPVTAHYLKETGDAELIEGNHWGDVFWGVCRGVGKNHLGRLLMEIRDTLRN